MFFDLRSEFGESGFAGGGEMHGKYTMELNEIGIITFQKLG